MCPGRPGLSIRPLQGRGLRRRSLEGGGARGLCACGNLPREHPPAQAPNLHRAGLSLKVRATRPPRRAQRVQAAARGGRTSAGHPSFSTVVRRVSCQMSFDHFGRRSLGSADKRRNRSETATSARTQASRTTAKSALKISSPRFLPFERDKAIVDARLHQVFSHLVQAGFARATAVVSVLVQVFEQDATVGPDTMERHFAVL